MIAPVLLDFINLFTKEPLTKDVTIINNPLISYCFAKLKDPVIRVEKYGLDDTL